MDEWVGGLLGWLGGTSRLDRRRAYAVWQQRYTLMSRCTSVRVLSGALTG